GWEPRQLTPRFVEPQLQQVAFGTRQGQARPQRRVVISFAELAGPRGKLEGSGRIALPQVPGKLAQGRRGGLARDARLQRGYRFVTGVEVHRADSTCRRGFVMERSKGASNIRARGISFPSETLSARHGLMDPGLTSSTWSTITSHPRRRKTASGWRANTT